MRRLFVLFILMITTLSLYAQPVPSGCTLSEQTCVEAGGTRSINGVNVYSDCWKYAMSYTCGLPDPINTCTDYEKTCSLDIVSDCTQKIGGICVAYHYIYSCPTRICDGKTLMCGSQSFCLDGDCYDPKGSQTDSKDFAQNASDFAGVVQAAQDVADQELTDPNNLHIFTGEAADCGKAGLGIYNCCSDDGMVLHNCGDGEKKLYKAREKHIAVKVGECCAVPIRSLLSIRISHILSILIPIIIKEVAKKPSGDERV